MNERAQSPSTRPAEWAEALAWVGAAAAVGMLLRPWLDTPDFAMLHLLAVVLAATRVGAGPSLLSALVSVAAFDFLFVVPHYTFRVSDHRFFLTFAVMLAVGVIVSRLTTRISEQARAATERERRTAALYAMSGELANAVEPAEISRIATRHLREHLGCEAVVVLGADAIVNGGGLRVPLVGSRGSIGVLSLATPAGGLSGDQRLIADAFVRQTALALERALLAVEAETARVAAETERLRNELLSAVSHDLRTPLASITGSATAMLADPSLDVNARQELLHTIREEGEHLGRLLTDLLDLTRIDESTVHARREWCPVEEVLDAAVVRMEARLAGRVVSVDVPDDMLMAPMEPILVGQVVVNLLENAVKHTPAGSPIDVVARSRPGWLAVEVLDRGAGIAEAERERIFDKFYRTADGQRAHGTGLGLAICRAVVRAHGGRIAAHARDGGGARFVVELPIDAEEAPR